MSSEKDKSYKEVSTNLETNKARLEQQRNAITPYSRKKLPHRIYAPWPDPQDYRSRGRFNTAAYDEAIRQRMAMAHRHTQRRKNAINALHDINTDITNINQTKSWVKARHDEGFTTFNVNDQGYLTAYKPPTVRYVKRNPASYTTVFWLDKRGEAQHSIFKTSSSMEKNVINSIKGQGLRVVRTEHTKGMPRLSSVRNVSIFETFKNIWKWKF